MSSGPGLAGHGNILSVCQCMEVSQARRFCTRLPYHNLTLCIHMAAAVEDLERRCGRLQQWKAQTMLSVQSVTVCMCVGSGGGEPGGCREGAQAGGAAGGRLGRAERGAAQGGRAGDHSAGGAGGRAEGAAAEGRLRPGAPPSGICSSVPCNPSARHAFLIPLERSYCGRGLLSAASLYHARVHLWGKPQAVRLPMLVLL